MNVKAIQITKKEFLVEFRTRYALTSGILFVLTTLSIIVFSTTNDSKSAGIFSGFLWIILFFTTMTLTGKIFIEEEEKGTSLYLRSIAEPFSIFVGKVVFAIITSVVINLIASLMLPIFITEVTIQNLIQYVLVVILGSVALASVTTILSSIIAKASSKNGLLPILGFPILLPLVVIGVDATYLSIHSADWTTFLQSILFMIAYSGVMIIVSIWVFPLIWLD
jgi:heme exporter protein B